MQAARKGSNTLFCFHTVLLCYRIAAITESYVMFALQKIFSLLFLFHLLYAGLKTTQVGLNVDKLNV